MNAARRERDRESTGAVVGLLGLVNPAAGTILGALSALSSPAPQAEADPTHPDPQLEITWGEGVQSHRFVSARIPDIVRPVWDYALLVPVRADSAGTLRIRVRDVDGADQEAPLIGETEIPLAELAGVLETGRATTWTRANHEVHELTVRAQPVPREGVLFEGSVDLTLRQGIERLDQAIPAGAVMRAYASGYGQIGGGWACPAEVSPMGRPGNECRGYNLAVEALRETSHGGAVVLLGTDSVTGVSLLPTDFDPLGDACVEFAAPAFGRPVVGLNDRQFGDNQGSFHFDVRYSVPPDEVTYDSLALPMPCAEFLDDDGLYSGDDE